MEDEASREGTAPAPAGRSRRKVLVATLVVLGLLLIILAILAWTGGGHEPLPFDYDSF